MTIEQTPTTETGVADKPSPNEDYKNNPLLDENGNPKPAPAPTTEVAPNKDTTTPVEEQDNTKPPSPDWTNLSGLERLETFLKEASLKPSDVAKAVAENGGRITPDILKALEEKHGAGVAALLSEQVVQVHKDSVAAVQARDNAAYKVLEEAFAGITTQPGSETFKELKGWAEANVPKEERAELNVMLQKGGLSAKLALTHLANEFKSTAKLVVPAGLVQGDRTSTSNDLKPISQQEYTSQLRALEQKGHVYGQSQEMANLDAQRLAGRKRGI
jgi:hypothetical protein